MTQPEARYGSYFVPAHHKAVLRAIVLNGEEGRTAFFQWAGTVDFDAIDYKIQTLMPALYKKAKSLDISHPLLPRMKSLYAYFFTKNALLLSGISPVLEIYSTEGIPFLLLKGAAGLARFGLAPGTRPMSDIDLLIRPADLKRALGIAKRCGFGLKYGGERQRLFIAPHSYDLLSKKGLGLDLHAYALVEHMYPGCDAKFWERAVACRFLGHAAFLLSPEDDLIHLCVNGVRELAAGAREPTSLLWIPDAARLLRAGVRWENALETAKAWFVTGQVLIAAGILREIDPGLVPQEALTVLESCPVMTSRVVGPAGVLMLRREELDRKIASHIPGFFNLGFKWRIHTHQSLGQNFFIRAIFFPRFLQKSWELENLGQIPGYIFNKLLFKLNKGDGM